MLLTPDRCYASPGLNADVQGGDEVALTDGLDGSLLASMVAEVPRLGVSNPGFDGSNH